VNLQTGTIEKNLPVTIKVYDLALGPNNWVYASMQGGWGTAVSIDIATGIEVKQDLLYRGERFRIHPNGASLYAVESGSYPNDVNRFSIAEGAMKYQYDSPYHGDYSICGPLWFTEDTRMITGCGTVLRTANTQNEDLKYAGTLSGISGRLISASHSAARRIIAVLPEPAQNADSQLTLHDDQFLSLAGKLTLPAFPAGGAAIKSVGRHVFWNKASSRILVVMQAASGDALNDFALHTVSPEFSGGCSVTLGGVSASVGPTGSTTGSIAVTAATDCVWEAKSNVPWITITGGLFDAGIGNIGYTVALNTSVTARTGTITAGGQTFTISQAAGDGTACLASLSTPTLIAQANGGAGTVNLNISGGCNWAASSSVSWIQVFPLNGAGAGTINYTVYPNYTTANRFATLTIAGRAVNITQVAAAGSANDRFVSLMYFNSLGRLPTPAEVAFHSGNLGWMSRADTVMNFINSEEFNRAGRFIAGLYVGVLGRDAEFDGWLFQRNALVTGWTSQEQLVPAFLGSAEFGLKYGTLTDTAFVQLLYRNILGREGSMAEVDFQRSVLQAGTMRQQMAQSFLNAPEFRIRNDKRLTAFLLYSVLLLRSVTPQELANRVQQMNAGLTPKALVEAIVQSPEFAALLR
jgi:hypothetical protein